MRSSSQSLQQHCILRPAAKPRRWDMVESHPSVAVLLYHRQRQAVVLVRQVRCARCARCGVRQCARSYAAPLLSVHVSKLECLSTLWPHRSNSAVPAGGVCFGHAGSRGSRPTQAAAVGSVAPSGGLQGSVEVKV